MVKFMACGSGLGVGLIYWKCITSISDSKISSWLLYIKNPNGDHSDEKGNPPQSWNSGPVGFLVTGRNFVAYIMKMCYFLKTKFFLTSGYETPQSNSNDKEKHHKWLPTLWHSLSFGCYIIKLCYFFKVLYFWLSNRIHGVKSPLQESRSRNVVKWVGLWKWIKHESFPLFTTECMYTANKLTTAKFRWYR